MSQKPPSSAPRQNALGEAVNWITRTEAPFSAADDWQALFDWMNASPQNVSAIQRLDCLYADLALIGDMMKSAGAASQEPGAFTPQPASLHLQAL